MTTTSDIQLNEQQTKAATSKAKIIVCSAGPGSGKTATLAGRVRYLLSTGVHPSKIGVITFTASGAKELQRRLDGVKLGICSTLHAYLLRMLNRNGAVVGLPNKVSVIDEETANDTFAGILKELRLTKKSSEADQLQAIKTTRMFAMGIDTGTPRPPATPLNVAAIEYHRRMKETGELDYDAVLQYGWQVINLYGRDVVTIDHLLVDEIQDNAMEDWYIYNRMSVDTVFYVGDNDQSIYSFRGAVPERMVALTERLDVELVPLITNYRSGHEIVAASQSLIRKNKIRIKTEALADREGGFVFVSHCQTPNDELATIANILNGNTDAAVLWRTNKQATTCRDYLRGLGVKVQMPKLFGKPGVKAATAALQFINNPWSDAVALRWLAKDTKLDVEAIKGQAVKEMRSVAGCVNYAFTAFEAKNNWTIDELVSAMSQTKISPESAQWIRTLATTVPEPFTLSDLLAAAVVNKEEPEQEGVFISTAHSSKGMEFDTVIVAGMETQTWNRNPETEEEDRRLAYVAMTRAKERLVLTWCATRPAVGRVWITEPKTISKFVTEATKGFK